MCCNLVSTKVQDGIARFLIPSQVDRLKAKCLKEKVDAAETALAEQWALTNIHILTGRIDKATAFRMFGALWLGRVCS